LPPSLGLDRFSSEPAHVDVACAQALNSVPPLGTLISDRGIVLNAAAHKIYAVDQAHGSVIQHYQRGGKVLLDFTRPS